MPSSLQPKEIVYDIQLLAGPSNGIFEATAKYLVSSDRFIVASKEISRINKYGMASHCVGTSFPHLAKFCFCNEQPKETSDSYMKVVMG